MKGGLEMCLLNGSTNWASSAMIHAYTALHLPRTELTRCVVWSVCGAQRPRLGLPFLVCVGSTGVRQRQARLVPIIHSQAGTHLNVLCKYQPKCIAETLANQFDQPV